MAEVRGVELHVLDVGSGTPLLWGHGFASCTADEERGLLDWQRLTAGHRVLRWDARGHGRSGGSSDADQYRWDNLGLDLLGLADARRIDRFVAGGVSMGAATALHAAVQAPERVTGMVLALPPTAYETRPAQAAQYEADARLVESSGMRAYLAHANTDPPPPILGQVPSGYDFTPAVTEQLLPALLRGAAASDLPPPDQLRRLHVPALILAWPDDPGHPLSTAERLAELLPNARLVVATQFRDVASWTTEVIETLDQPNATART